MKEIINRNVRCKQQNDRLKLVIYYKSATTKSLIMKNNQNTPPSKFQQCNLIYEYQCKLDGCEHLQNSSYIGLTSTTLSRRLTLHLGEGGPKKHSFEAHRTTLTRQMLEQSTSILKREQSFDRLHIIEAIMIQARNPAINKQITGRTRTLKLFSLPIISPAQPH